MKTVSFNELNDIFQTSYGYFCWLYKCIYQGKPYALKSFKSHDLINKNVEKINQLGDNVHEASLTIPKFWVANSENKLDLLLPWFDGKDLVSIENDCLPTKIKLLRKIKECIIIMHFHKIIHGDISSANIMVNNGEVAITDFDNCSYAGYSTDLEACNILAKAFIKRYGLCSELDIFLFNIITYELIYGCSNDDLKRIIYGRSFRYTESLPTKEIINEFFLCKRYPTNKFLIDNIDETNFTI